MKTSRYDISKLRGRFLRRFKDYGLPISIVIGIVGYRHLSLLSPTIPYMLMVMLFFSFLKLTPREIRLRPVHLYLQFLQLLLSVVGYFVVLHSGLPHSRLLAEGIMICFFCPAASASPVVIGFLGGNIAIGTTYVLLTSLGVTIFAPILLGFFGSGTMDYGATFVQVFYRVLPIITIPLVLAWLTRYRVKPLYRALIKIPSAGFWVWIVTLSLIMANTVYFMAQEPREMIPTMLLLGLMGLVACVVQFAVGKRISRRVLGESITLGQSLGQKNSTISIWLAQSYLTPLSSVAMASYSIWQNLLNAYQIQRSHHSSANETSRAKEENSL